MGNFFPANSPCASLDVCQMFQNSDKILNAVVPLTEDDNAANTFNKANNLLDRANHLITAFYILIAIVILIFIIYFGVRLGK